MDSEKEALERFKTTGIIRGQRLAWKNRKGEVVLAVKNKKEYGYYIFEFYPERVEKERREVVEDCWKALKALASAMHIPLYEMSEIMLLGNKATEIWLENNPGKMLPVWPEQIDVDVPIYDHASDRYGKLTVGISAANEETERHVMSDKE